MEAEAWKLLREGRAVPVRLRAAKGQAGCSLCEASVPATGPVAVLLLPADLGEVLLGPDDGGYAAWVRKTVFIVQAG